MTAPAADPPSPAPLRPPPLRARTLMIAVAAVVLLAWLAVILLDGYDLGGTRGWRTVDLFELLFSDRPVEWLQWLGLATLAVGAAYTGGRLTGTALHRERAFWLLIAVGAGLILLEDAGDIRHVIRADARGFLGDEPLGIPIRLLVEVPYFAALAALPVYALVRHGPVIWTYRPVRPYLATGFVLYGIVAGVVAVPGIGSMYTSLGEQLSSLLGIERLPTSPLTEERFHFRLIDGAVEESVELLAVGALLAALLAFVATVSSGLHERSGSGGNGQGPDELDDAERAQA